MGKYSWICLMFLGVSVYAQTNNPPNQADSILSFQEAKARLMRANLGLLASYYDVNIAKAGVIQARLWNNPYFLFNGDIYSSESNEYFHFRNQHLLQVEQTFSYAGKHTNTVKLAKVNVELAERQLEDILRALLLELGNTYSSLGGLQVKQLLYQQVIESYERLMEATQKQLQVGTISLTESLRLQSEYLAVKNDALLNFNEIQQVMSDFKILLRFPEDTTVYVEQPIPPIAEDFNPQVLADQAIVSRPDVQLRTIGRKYEERNLKLQKSTAVPDIKLAYQPRDRGSNYSRPYQGFNIEIFLPVFNRNQGEIKAAEFRVRQSALYYDQVENQVRNEVVAAYERYKNSSAGLANYSAEFLEQLRRLNESTNDAFQKRNISLLQFIDQQRIYIQTNIQLIELKQQYLNNVNELNFAVGTNIVEY